MTRLLKRIHMSLLRFSVYRAYSRKKIRTIKTALGCPDAWGELIAMLRNHPKAMYLDVGAHTGATVQRISDECSNPIHAFEPTPSSYQLLSDRFAGNKAIKIWNLALSDKTDKMRFYLNANSQTNSILDNAEGNRQMFPGQTDHQEVVDVNVISLDDWLAGQADPDIQFVIKCDVQGAEKMVIEGGKRSLQKQCIAFYSEVQLVEMYKGQCFFREVDEMLSREAGLCLREVYPAIHAPDGRAIQADALWINPHLF
jgi:FkbM family methyltransferase